MRDIQKHLLYILKLVKSLESNMMNSSEDLGLLTREYSKSTKLILTSKNKNNNQNKKCQMVLQGRI